MAKDSINTQDSINTDDVNFKNHAAYIFKALQHVRSCVVIDGAQLATEDGFPKAKSVQMQISRIAVRWGLNIRTTTGGGAGGAAVVRASSTSARKARTSTPKEEKQLAIEWHCESGDRDNDTDAMKIPLRARARKSPRTPKPKKRDRNFVYDDISEEEEVKEEEDAELKPSPAKKRFFYPVWTSEDEDNAEGDEYVTTETELLNSTDTIEVR